MTSRRHYEGLPSGSVMRARSLRRDATEPEKRLCSALREKLPAVKFRRQVPHGAYIADFLCFGAQLIVEVDGATHAERTEQDALRTRYFEAQGYHVLRVWNHEVMDNIDGVLTQISLCLRDRDGSAPIHRTPSPSHA